MYSEQNLIQYDGSYQHFDSNGAQWMLIEFNLLNDILYDFALCIFIFCLNNLGVEYGTMTLVDKYERWLEIYSMLLHVLIG